MHVSLVNKRLADLTFQTSAEERKEKKKKESINVDVIWADYVSHNRVNNFRKQSESRWVTTKKNWHKYTKKGKTKILALKTVKTLQRECIYEHQLDRVSVGDII